MNGSFKGRRQQSKHYMSVHHHCNLSRRHHSPDTHRLQADNYVNTKRLSSALDTNNATYVTDHYQPSFPRQNNNEQKQKTTNKQTKQNKNPSTNQIPHSETLPTHTRVFTSATATATIKLLHIVTRGCDKLARCRLGGGERE